MQTDDVPLWTSCPVQRPNVNSTGNNPLKKQFFPLSSGNNLRENESNVSLAVREPLKIYSAFQVGIFREALKNQNNAAKHSKWQFPFHYDAKLPAVSQFVRL